MTSEQYRRLEPQIPFINIFFNEKTWGGNIDILNNVAVELGYKTNLGCTSCKAELVKFMYYRVLEFENQQVTPI